MSPQSTALQTTDKNSWFEKAYCITVTKGVGKGRWVSVECECVVVRHTTTCTT